MNSRATIFSDIVFRSPLKREDVATNGLAYILNANRKVASKFKEFVERSADIKLPPFAMFETQVAQQDTGRPDIVASTAEGRQLLFIENKFWAGLTENQPVSYLKRLKKNRSEIDAAALVFVCPERSTHMYRDELLRRIKSDSELSLMNTSVDEPFQEPRFEYKIDMQLALIIVPWSRLLELLSIAAADAEDRGLVEDVAQLKSLIERVDEEEAFLPIRSEELGAEFGRRYWAYNKLIGSLRDKLKAEPYRMGYIQNSDKLDLGGLGKWRAFICMEPYLWGRFGMSPFWLLVWKDMEHYELIKMALHVRLTSFPSGAFECKWNNSESLCVPLVPPLGVDKDKVLMDLAAQVVSIRDAIALASEKVDQSQHSVFERDRP